MITTLTAPRLLNQDYEIETLAYSAGLAGENLVAVLGRVVEFKHSDATAYYIQGKQDQARETTVPPEMNSESRMEAFVHEFMERHYFAHVSIMKRWDFNKYAYTIVAWDCNRKENRSVIHSQQLEDVVGAVKAWVRDDQSRVAVSQLFQPAEPAEQLAA